MKYILYLCAFLVIALVSSCKKQTKTVIANIVWNDSHFVYVDDTWYAAIAEGTSDNYYVLSYKQLTRVLQGVNKKISFSVEDSKAAKHTIVIFNDSNGDKKFTEADTYFSVQTVALSTEKEITVDISVSY
ncbi:MAG TPA: hypothetical protein P5243_11150 [Bacteroidales bacterium]|nr:hypothetical protein [Bacteroidales bacterium]HRS20053.1 hypothetical protein [Bacteroidales bacterium]